MVARHNHLWDIFANFCRRAHISGRAEVGYGLARDHVNSRPADVLVQGWDKGKSAAFDVTVALLLTPVTLNSASTSVGAAAEHAANDTRCQEKPYKHMVTGDGVAECFFLPCLSTCHWPGHPQTQSAG